MVKEISRESRRYADEEVCYEVDTSDKEKAIEEFRNAYPSVRMSDKEGFWAIPYVDKVLSDRLGETTRIYVKMPNTD